MQERGAISDRAGQQNADEAIGLFMLFQRGGRPDADAIQDIVSGIDGVTVSHTPSPASGGPDWLEVTIDGLSFDISGLEPGSPIQAPPFPDADEGMQAIVVAAGPHLAGGLYLLPILRGLLRLGAGLSEELSNLHAFGWAPSNSMIEPSLFRSSVKAWNDGGAFPVSLLTRFNDTSDGGMQSDGLAAFTGQELRLEPDLATQKDIAHRVGERLIHQLVLRGRVEAVEEITGPQGNTLRLEPSQNGHFVRVWRG